MGECGAVPRTQNCLNFDDHAIAHGATEQPALTWRDFLPGMNKETMATDTDAQIHLDPVTKRGSKVKRENAIAHLGNLLHDLVRRQCDLIEAGQSNQSRTSLGEERLAAFDKAMPLLLTAFAEILKIHQIKQAGGRPMHKHFGVAYQLLKEHYQMTGKIYRANALIRAVHMQVNEGRDYPDEDGKYAISELVARDCINMFKISLPYENFNVSG